MRGARRVATASLALALVSGCPREHDPGRVEVAVDDCVECHLDEYSAVEYPVHDGELPADTCASCHTTEAWIPSIYDHKPRVSQCVTCHEHNYQATTDPAHPGMYSTTCDDCHSTTAWRPAGRHPEAKFPINGGPHEHVTCEDCHNIDLGPSTGGENTDCIGCHTGEHSRSRMDDKHLGEVNGYSWEQSRPNFCLDCHPNGRK